MTFNRNWENLLSLYRHSVFHHCTRSNYFVLNAAYFDTKWDKKSSQFFRLLKKPMSSECRLYYDAAQNAEKPNAMWPNDTRPQEKEVSVEV